MLVPICVVIDLFVSLLDSDLKITMTIYVIAWPVLFLERSRYKRQLSRDDSAKLIVP